LTQFRSPLAFLRGLRKRRRGNHGERHLHRLTSETVAAPPADRTALWQEPRRTATRTLCAIKKAGQAGRVSSRELVGVE
jgi:hypothetical protein